MPILGVDGLCGYLVPPVKSRKVQSIFYFVIGPQGSRCMSVYLL